MKQCLEGASHLSARCYLLGGDELGELAAAFAKIYRRVRELREEQNKRFAELLAAWSKSPTAEKGILPIEQVIPSVLTGLAAQVPVLLLVVDGMDYAVFRELYDDARRQGWTEYGRDDGEPLPAVVATVPTVTELSRASLLAGKAICGASAVEKNAFATHPALMALSRPRRPPVLFHKGELSEAGGLASAVRAAIADPEQRIVAAVLNAVDDHLAKSEQMRVRWRLAQLRLLDALLYEAGLADRVVVLTADHGHVLEENNTALSGGEEARWRR
jgi:hypothetical protein